MGDDLGHHRVGLVSNALRGNKSRYSGHGSPNERYMYRDALGVKLGHRRVRSLRAFLILVLFLFPFPSAPEEKTLTAVCDRNYKDVSPMREV